MEVIGPPGPRPALSGRRARAVRFDLVLFAPANLAPALPGPPSSPSSPAISQKRWKDISLARDRSQIRNREEPEGREVAAAEIEQRPGPARRFFSPGFRA